MHAIWVHVVTKKYMWLYYAHKEKQEVLTLRM